jgi:hypothetical protein
MDDDDDEVGDLTHAMPAYKRAVWTVLLLNLGYGVIEISGGFLAGSQGSRRMPSIFSATGRLRYSAFWRSRGSRPGVPAA